MENFFKSSIKQTFHYIKNKITSKDPQSYKLIETHHKIIYFSAFNLEISEFETIYSFIKTIKENLFKKLLDATKYTVKQIISITDLETEREKVLVLFSVCFLHYYTNFSYNQCPNFNLYFTQDLLALCLKFKIKIENLNQFKVYCYSFYYQMINELKQFEYDAIKKLYNNNNSNNDIIKRKITLQNSKGVVDKNIILPIISAKERIIDMVYYFGSNNSLNENPIPFNNNTDFNKITNHLYEIYTNNEEESKKIQINNTEEQNPGIININSISNTTPGSGYDNETISSTNSSLGDNQIFSKRILCELVKSNLDESTAQIIQAVSSCIDISYFDSMLMQKKNDDLELINPFICYIIELNSSVFNSTFHNLPGDFIFRFIFPAKNIYVHALEIYFSIHDLAYTEMASFNSILKIKFGFINEEDNLFKCLFYFYKQITDELISLKNNNPEGSANEDIKLFLNILEKMQVDWKECILQKCQQLTTFCSL